MHKRPIFGDNQLMTTIFHNYSASESDEHCDDLGEKLAQEQRFAYNTLPFVFELLDTFSLMRCGQVCKLWHDLVCDWRLWRSIELYGCKVSFPKMMNAYKDRSIVALKLIDCKLKKQGPKDNLWEFLGGNRELKVLEVSDCPSQLIKMLPNQNRCLETVRVSLVCCATGMKLNLDLIFLLPRLLELKLYCNRELDNFHGLFGNLGNLRHLYLLGVKNLDLQLLHTVQIPKSCRLESLGLGDCQLLANSFGQFLQALPALKRLRLERCSEWQAFVVLESISKCAQLETLELLDFNINKQFEIGLRLCTNLKQLTVIPNPHRFQMGAFNARVFRGSCGLKRTLKKFTWGFSRKYMDYFFRMYKTVNRVPFSDGDEISNASELILLEDLEDRLQAEMKATQIVVTTSITSGDVFSIRP
ncbi:F-box/LRR-repeat protein 7 [Dendroctonus ponderosae]|uniref:F-box domain-containing protein n=1 Tax=Dendroctonus ponderosae TaxID=77166 RepID=A0AAR5NYD1_DENPD|nr:F-box/LRR-repeat protein 7 [Dendroctonus ponderosae]